MVDIKWVTDDFGVAGQLTPGDVAALAAAGVRSIVCNRPDNESGGQANFAEIAAEASALSIETRYIPVSLTGIAASDVEHLKSALATLPGPILAYCRSGARSLNLYGLATR